jgi:F0F1-type ATP synthase assembly protein I
MEDKNKSGFFYAISLAFQLGFLIAIPLSLFLLLGIFLDKKFSLSPVFTILFIVFSFVFLFFEIRNYLLPFLKKNKPR